MVHCSYAIQLDIGELRANAWSDVSFAGHRDAGISCRCCKLHPTRVSVIQANSQPDANPDCLASHHAITYPLENPITNNLSHRRRSAAAHTPPANLGGHPHRGE